MIQIVPEVQDVQCGVHLIWTHWTNTLTLCCSGFILLREFVPECRVCVGGVYMCLDNIRIMIVVWLNTFQ